MTTIERLWKEMGDEGGSVWRLRLARKQGAHPLVVALHPHDHSRVLLVPVPGVTLPHRREWPECQGLEWVSINVESNPYWGVRLRDPACADVFAALARDLDARLALAAGYEQAAAELFGRVKLWHRFLKSWQLGMTLDARRGLWGELHVLNTHLRPALGSSAALSGWTAAKGAHQDFQFPRAAIEVKTTTAKQPQNIRITSERQLDESGVGALFLHVVIADEREVAGTVDGSCENLLSLVCRIRSVLEMEPATLALFNDLLFQRGWIDEQAQRYENHCMTLREELVFRVVPGFPRLLERDLPVGVGDVNFALSLAACQPFSISLSQMLQTLAAASEVS